MSSKSQISNASVVLLAWLLVLLESGVDELTSTGFVMFPTLNTLVTIVSVTVEALSSLPIVQILVFLSKVPLVAVYETNLNESGMSSKTFTSKAALGP